MLKPRELSLKTSVCGLAMLALAGCVGTTETTSAPAETDTSSRAKATPMTQKQRFISAIEHLEYGRVEQATEMLTAYLAISPNSKNARDLLNQITTSSQAYFPSEYFTVNLESGESLSTLSREYLGSALKFFALAKFNDIKNPSRVNVGQEINVPLTDLAKSVLAKQNGQVPEEPAAQATVTESPSEEAQAPEVAAQDAPSQPQEEAPEHTPDALSATLPAPQASVTAASLISQITALVANADFSAAMENVEKLKQFGDFDKPSRDLAIKALLGHGQAISDSDKVLASDRFTEAGQMQLINGDNMAALGSFSKAADLNPDNNVAMEDRMVLQKEMADKFHREASSAFRRQELDVAIANWNKVLEIDPDHSSAKVYLAQAKELKARLEQINN